MYVNEVVSGSVVASYTFTQSPQAGGNAWYDIWPDERYVIFHLSNNNLRIAAWDGGVPVPMSHGSAGASYGGIAYTETYTIQNVFTPGMAGFGVYGPSRVEAVRIAGAQAQPIPPGFILDTGMGVPQTEVIMPGCFVQGEVLTPASSVSCLRNEWGARVSNIVTGYNARWSY